MAFLFLAIPVIVLHVLKSIKLSDDDEGYLRVLLGLGALIVALLALNGWFMNTVYNCVKFLRKQEHFVEVLYL
uniref:G_PROTEIN_RECEP_F2_4 domain-containing protein n=1 Tax=Steinernema glaseri TaxID=37863 RepID=A0A1I7Z2N8_9BILA